MKTARVIRVLIIDDSLIFRETLARGLDEDPNFEIVGVSPDANSAITMVKELKPDVLTVDVEMLGMNGITFVKRIMETYPLPIIMVSSINESVFEALAAGALDFVAKPSIDNMGSKSFLSELSIKIKIAASSKLATTRKNTIYEQSEKGMNIKLIAIGASTGGTEAILSVLEKLPRQVPPIVIVQHIPPVFSRMFAERMNKMCEIEVKEAANGDSLTNGQVYIAPGDKHMRVTSRSGKLVVECSEGEKVSGHCPSVDVLFESVAATVGAQALGVILTGMGGDGARGLLHMKKRGAYTIGQDEKSSAVYGMPKEAWKIGAISIQVTLSEIPRVIMKQLL